MPMRRKTIRDRGASLVEFALVLPLLVLFLFGIVQFGILIALLNLGLQFISSTRAALLFSTFPLMTMVMAALLGRERLSAMKTVGVTLTVIDHGPGHWPGSANPGQLGNSVFAGHRVTHSHPFRRIHELVPGDDIVFKMANGTFTYKMTKSSIVTPKDVHIVNPTTDATVTLFACHPPGSARQRYVVNGVFVSSTPV